MWTRTWWRMPLAAWRATGEGGRPGRGCEGAKWCPWGGWPKCHVAFPRNGFWLPRCGTNTPPSPASAPRSYKVVAWGDIPGTKMKSLPREAAALVGGAARSRSARVAQALRSGGRGACVSSCLQRLLVPLPSLPLQVQYYLALGAHQFAGNSVALGDALLIMERWRANLYATYYNGGNIPLEAYLPLFP